MRHLIMMKLLILLISLTVIESFDPATHLRLTPVSPKGRSPDILEIKYHHQNRVELIILRKVEDTTLEPNFLPIVCIDEDEEGPHEDQQLLGIDPTFYHGVNSYSAITYFPHDNTLHGVIDNRFYIEKLPKDDATNPDVVANHIHPMSKTLLANREHALPNNRRDRAHNKRKLEPDHDPIPKKKFKESESKHESNEILYPEIMLAVDVSSRINEANDGVDRYDNVMMYVLSYWNAVDMLFRRLKHTNIRISIAGVVIGKTADFIDYMMNDTDYSVEGDETYIPKDEALQQLGIYFSWQNRFKRDSFDFVMWMTRAQLIDDYISPHTSRENIGIAAPPAQCGGLHHQESITRVIANRAIFMHDDHYTDYQLAARELAHLMFVSDDDVEVSSRDHHSNCMPASPSLQTSGIMDPVNKQMTDSLLWSFCSEIHFERYASSVHSCCLYNFPYRTMIRPRTPIQPLTLAKQCQCYGMRASQRKCERDICAGNLKCKNKSSKFIDVARPLDGTLCGAENSLHICINNRCVQ